MSDCLFPLDLMAGKCGFPWLLHGDERQNRKIIGMNGLSPRLMHYFAKVTFLSMRLYKVTPLLLLSLLNTFSLRTGSQQRSVAHDRQRDRKQTRRLSTMVGHYTRRLHIRRNTPSNM
jgi:hypothetical protein